MGERGKRAAGLHPLWAIETAKPQGTIKERRLTRNMARRNQTNKADQWLDRQAQSDKTRESRQRQNEKATSPVVGNCSS